MAASHTYVHFKDTPRPDDLCPHCFNPSLKVYTLEKIDLDGITLVGERIACSDCKVWIGPMKEFK